MKFSIGYQLPDEYDSIAEICSDYRDHISSVYFSLPGNSSARSMIDPEAAPVMREELSYIHSLGIEPVLLFNASCYGADARSTDFEKGILSDIDQVNAFAELKRVTTTSPFAARVIKQHFPEISVTASVNMWIGTVQAMEYLGDDFDGYYLQREYNRNFRKIREMKTWCDQHQKKLYLLANSGCLYSCPFHTFHDNMVAHEAEVSRKENAMGKYPSPCWELMHRLDPVDAAAVYLQESWVRPQDIVQYEPYFSEMKLATRMHYAPRRVISAYIRGKYNGNMFDLTEPSFSSRFKDHVLDAACFPSDWFERTSDCSKQCSSCGYCRDAALQMLKDKYSMEKLYLS